LRVLDVQLPSHRAGSAFRWPGGLGAQSYIQQIFYGAALAVAITIPKATRRRIFQRKQLA
jgi:hypothetical protein